MGALVSMNDIIGEIRRAKGKDAANAIAASLEAGKQRQRASQAEEDLEETKKMARKETAAAVATVLVTTPIAAAAGYLVAEFAHDKVVERLGKDNMATPFVLPLVGGAVAYYGYSGKGLQLDERAALVGGGVGIAAAGLKRSYYDFWAAP